MAWDFGAWHREVEMFWTLLDGRTVQPAPARRVSGVRPGFRPRCAGAVPALKGDGTWRPGRGPRPPAPRGTRTGQGISSRRMAEPAQPPRHRTRSATATATRSAPGSRRATSRSSAPRTRSGARRCARRRACSSSPRSTTAARRPRSATSPTPRAAPSCSRRRARSSARRSPSFEITHRGYHEVQEVARLEHEHVDAAARARRGVGEDQRRDEHRGGAAAHRRGRAAGARRAPAPRSPASPGDPFARAISAAVPATAARARARRRRRSA